MRGRKLLLFLFYMSRQIIFQSNGAWNYWNKIYGNNGENKVDITDLFRGSDSAYFYVLFGDMSNRMWYYINNKKLSYIHTGQSVVRTQFSQDQFGLYVSGHVEDTTSLGSGFWSGTYTDPEGETHRFDIDIPLLVDTLTTTTTTRETDNLKNRLINAGKYLGDDEFTNLIAQIHQLAGTFSIGGVEGFIGRIRTESIASPIYRAWTYIGHYNAKVYIVNNSEYLVELGQLYASSCYGRNR